MAELLSQDGGSSGKTDLRKGKIPFQNTYGLTITHPSCTAQVQERNEKGVKFSLRKCVCGGITGFVFHNPNLLIGNNLN